ncbi:MAG: hypothetical protein U0V70_05385 [Terriglobia bacterium]
MATSTGKPSLRLGVIATALCFNLTASAQAIAKLRPETLASFNDYVKSAESSIQLRIEKKIPALWLYENPENRARALQGKIVTERLNTPQTGAVAGGMIHDWIAGMFIPGASIGEVLQVLQDFNRHKQIYPEVIDSKLIKRDGNTYLSYLRLKKEKIITVVLDTEHEATYLQVEPNRWVCRSYSRKIAEVNAPDTSDEKELPPGEDHGFLWRLNAYWQLQQVSEGVFLECRAVSLTRDVPTMLAWLINPIISDLPGESLRGTLEASRAAIQARTAARVH